jgi:probable F420-dependent oxidoreductase
VVLEREHDRHEMYATVWIEGSEPGDARRGHALTDYARRMHLGVILPNYGEHASPEGMRRVAEAAEELGYDSVWATEHIIVGPEAAETYGRVFEPYAVLGWIAGFTERVSLGTSITLVPLHHPIELAKQIATLQLLAGRPFLLGVGMGWHEDEYRFMGVEFRRRGRRADEALRVVKALWAGETSFAGSLWSFEDATFAPLPETTPEIWVGGSSKRAIRRARELGDVWHPSRRSDPGHVREVKQRHPELRVVPRSTPENAEGFLEAGAEGVVVTLPDERAMREFAHRFR